MKCSASLFLLIFGLFGAVVADDSMDDLLGDVMSDDLSEMDSKPGTKTKSGKKKADDDVSAMLRDTKPVNIKVAATKEKNSVRIDFTLQSPVSIKIEVDYEGARKPKTIELYPAPQRLQKYISYQDLAAIKASNPQFMQDPGTVYPNAKITFDGMGLDYYSLPYFDRYNDNVIKKEVNKWVDSFPSWEKIPFSLDICSVPEEREIRFFLNGNYAYRIVNTAGLKSVHITRGKGPIVKTTLYKNVEKKTREIDFAKMHHTSELFDNPASLSIKTGEQVFDGVPMKVFAPEKSLDAGRVRMMCYGRSLFDNPYWERTPFHNMPEALHFTVPNKFYSHALVLCAAIPQDGRVPVFGTRLTRMGGIGANSRAQNFLDLSAQPLPANVKEVGRLNYTDGKGKKCTAPLYLVKHSLNAGQTLDLINDPKIYADGYLHRTLPRLHNYLDFEFLGDRNIFQGPLSSVQIFGCTLIESPFTMEMRQTEHGNLFANDEKPETGVEVSGTKGAKGFVQYDIYSSDFEPLKKGEIPFEIQETGKKQVIKVDLAMDKLGWYGLNFRLLNDKREELFAHEAAFALLGKDTREAGYESPFAAWPQQSGRHNSNPDMKEVAGIMHKAGYHSSWHQTVKSEDEIPEYQITFSMVSLVGRPYDPDKNFEERANKGVEEIKEMRKRFPHLKQVMVLHEAGGRELAPEMLNRVAEAKPYDPVNGDSLTRFAMKCAQRIRKEFPDMKILLGNGSSSSEMIAHLFRNGFDPKLVDYLGIESKGFGTMPEICDNLQAPGMAWALRETAKRFGHDIPVSACNEFVFRPERVVDPKSDYLQVTKYTVRDYLLCLGKNFLTISTGHIEDCKTSYYDTNWGAGGQLKCFPYSYPKRMYVALATLSKVMDKTTFSRRVATDGASTYALEFKRARKSPDFSYAFWTPRFEAELKAVFPSGSTITQTDMFGDSRILKQDADGAVTIRFSGVPTYLVSDKAVVSTKNIRHIRPAEPQGKKESFPLTVSGVEQWKTYVLGNRDPIPGEFRIQDVKDAEMGQVLEMKLIPGKLKIPEVVTEYQLLKLKKPIRFDSADFSKVGVYVKGNSSWGSVRLEWMDAKSNFKVTSLGTINFEGWQLMQADVPSPKNMRWGFANEGPYYLTGVYVESGRQALDPLEMQPVNASVLLGQIVRFAK